MDSKDGRSTTFRNDFFCNLKRDLKNHKFVMAVLLITTATFGFTFFNFSLGIDDFGFRYYMNLTKESYGNMIQQGRLLHVVLYYITGLVDVVPFLNNFLSAILMALSAVATTALVNTAANSTLRTYEKILFFGLCVSYPAVAFKFIYDLDVLAVAISYLAVVFAVVYTFEFTQNRRKKDGIKAVLLTAIAISSYETFVSFFGCLVILCLILASIHSDITFKPTIKKGLWALGVLAVTIASYYLLVFLVQHATNNPAYPRLNLFTQQDAPIYLALLGILGKSINPWVFFSLENLVAIFGFIFLGFYFVKKTGKKYLHLLFWLFFLCLYSVNIAQGALYYRSCQTFCLFVSTTALLFMILFRDKKPRKAVLALLTLLLLLQIKDTNTWFFKDWTNYQKNNYAIHRIATDLHS